MFLIRSILVGVWRFCKKNQLKNQHVFLDSQVLFNQYTKFGEYCKIHKYSDITDAEIGSYSYIGQRCVLSNCLIGKFCSIAANVKVISSTHPTREYVSTSPVFHSLQNQCGTTFVKETNFQEIQTINNRYAVIGNDVWLGEDVSILGGITIGDRAIVAAGSIVTKNVPPYAIVGGVPAKIIRYRFDEITIKELRQDQWWNKSVDWIKKNAYLFTNIKLYTKYIKQ